MYDFSLLREGWPGKRKVENGEIVLVIRILQDEPIRETRENLIPFRRMIKGRKSYIMATMMMTNHYHDIILMVTVNVMMKTKVTSIFLKVVQSGNYL